VKKTEYQEQVPLTDVSTLAQDIPSPVDMSRAGEQRAKTDAGMKIPTIGYSNSHDWTISLTGVAKGFGRHPFHRVWRLTSEERQKVLAGGIVLVAGCPGHVNGRTGVGVRQVKFSAGLRQFVHRVPDPSVLRMLSARKAP
jgi:hypothetical protein